eukprot:s2531_g12.t1
MLRLAGSIRRERSDVDGHVKLVTHFTQLEQKCRSQEAMLGEKDAQLRQLCEAGGADPNSQLRLAMLEQQLKAQEELWREMSQFFTSKIGETMGKLREFFKNSFMFESNTWDNQEQT